MNSIPEKLTTEQIAESICKTQRSVQIAANKQNWTFSEVASVGGKKRYYHFSSLPPTIKIAIQKHFAPDPVQLSLPLPVDTAGFPTPATSSAAEGCLPKSSERIARARADIVSLYLQARQTGKQKKQKSADITKNFLSAFNSGLTFPELFKTLNTVSRSTLERWRKDLEDANCDYQVLAPQWGKHRKGVSKLTEHESSILFTQVFHQNRVKTGTAIEVTKYILEQQGLPSPSSPATMRRSIDQFKRQHFDLWTFYREGGKSSPR